MGESDYQKDTPKLNNWKIPPFILPDFEFPIPFDLINIETTNLDENGYRDNLYNFDGKTSKNNNTIKLHFKLNFCWG